MDKYRVLPVLKAALLLIVMTLAWAWKSSAVTWYVDTAGNDTLNGLQPVFISGYDGPKRTFNAAYALAASGDTIRCSDGYFGEDITVAKDIILFVKNTYFRKLTLNGSGIYLMLHGDSLHVVDTFKLQDGYVYTRGDAVKFKLIPNCLQMGGSAGSFVDGRYYIGHESLATFVFFHAGVDNDYRPLRIDFNKNGHDTVYFSCELNKGLAPVTGTFPSGIRNVSQVHYWHASASDYIKLDQFRLSAYYDTVATDDEVFEASRLRVMAHNGTGNWLSLGGLALINRKSYVSATLAWDTLAFVTIGNATGGFNPLGGREVFARFSNVVNCVGRASNFRDGSFSYKAAVTNWRWDFGVADSTGDTSLLQNPSYTYPRAGKYTVKLWVTNIFGFTDSFTGQADVRSNPVVKFGKTDVCHGRQTAFSDSSLAFSPDAIMSRSWQFGDGGTATTRNVTRTYTSPGVYNVKLIITTSTGCRDSLIKPTTVYAKPAPDFTVPANCKTDSAVFSRVPSVDPPDSIVTWTWKIDSVNLLNGAAVKYLFNAGGSHKARLIGVSKFGCTDSVTKVFTIYSSPTVSLSLSSGIAGNTMTQCLNGNKFTVTPSFSTTEGQTIASANWKWGDNTTSVLTDSSHSYPSENPYRIKLVGVTDMGCADSAELTVTVKGYLRTQFAKAGVCVPDSIRFFDSAVVSSSGITGRNWYLNGSLRSVRDTGKINVLTAGPHVVKLIMNNADGCTDSTTKTFSFISRPAISFTLNGSSPFCAGDSLTVTVNGGSRAVWLNDNDTNRTKVFRNAIRYRARVFNSPECFDTDEDTVLVYPVINVKAFNDTTIVRGGTAVLRAYGAATYIWTPSAGLNSAIGQTVRSKATATQQYVVTGTDINGCMGRDTVTVTVVAPAFVRIPNIITPNGDSENDAWDLRELEELDQYDLTITDYQGKVVYQSSSYLNDWKATDKAGEELPDGVYYYKLTHRGNRSELKGFIQVIR